MMQSLPLKITNNNNILPRCIECSETLPAITAAAKVKPRILICAPSNAAVDNIIMKIVDEGFMDGNGGKDVSFYFDAIIINRELTFYLQLNIDHRWFASELATHQQLQPCRLITK